jgi:hypothetical protein
MPTIYNPFDANPGFTLAELSTAMNILPNQYGRVSELGLFKGEGISQTTAIIDVNTGTLSLLPTVTRGGPATLSGRDVRAMRAFVMPHIPHNDVVTPDDIQGVRQFNSISTLETLNNVMTKKLTRMRIKHAQTKEFMRVNALKGILRDGAGVTLVNYFTEWGITKTTVDFVLGTAGTDIRAKTRSVVRSIKRNLLGDSMTGVRILVSPTFWDKFISHPNVVQAYQYYAATNGRGDPRGDDVSDGFKFQGAIFEEYDSTFTLFNQSTEDAFPGNTGMAFPVGTTDTFQEFWAPANWMETVNTNGLEFYSRQKTRDDGTGIEVLTQANPLPLVRRPGALVEIITSN